MFNDYEVWTDVFLNFHWFVWLLVEMANLKTKSFQKEQEGKRGSARKFLRGKTTKFSVAEIIKHVTHVIVQTYSLKLFQLYDLLP